MIWIPVVVVFRGSKSLQVSRLMMTKWQLCIFGTSLNQNGVSFADTSSFTHARAHYEWKLRRRKSCPPRYVPSYLDENPDWLWFFGGGDLKREISWHQDDHPHLSWCNCEKPTLPYRFPGEVDWTHLGAKDHPGAANGGWIHVEWCVNYVDEATDFFQSVNGCWSFVHSMHPSRFFDVIREDSAVDQINTAGRPFLEHVQLLLYFRNSDVLSFGHLPSGHSHPFWLVVWNIFYCPIYWE